MEEPIPIKKTEPLITEEEAMTLDKARHERQVQWVFLGLVSIVVIGFLIPLSVWLTRLALGG